MEQEFAAALVNAVKIGDGRTVARLLHGGADPNATDDAGNGPLHWAVHRGDTAMVDFLIAQPGTDVDRPDGLGYTALIGAVMHGYEDIVASLVASPRVDVEAAPDGITPLWAAVALADRDLAKSLLTRADPNRQPAHDGLSVWELAAGSRRLLPVQAGFIDIRFGIDRAALWAALVEGGVIDRQGTITEDFRRRRWGAAVVLPPAHARHTSTIHDLLEYCVHGDRRLTQMLKRAGR